MRAVLGMLTYGSTLRLLRSVLMRTAFARDAPTTIHRRRFGFVRMSARIAVLISGEGRNLQALIDACADGRIDGRIRSEEHTSELQSLMRISYAVFCLKK